MCKKGKSLFLIMELQFVYGLSICLKQIKCSNSSFYYVQLLFSARFRYYYLVECPVPLQGRAHARSSFSSFFPCGPGKEVLFHVAQASAVSDLICFLEAVALGPSYCLWFQSPCPLLAPGPNPMPLANHQSSQYFWVQGNV